MTVTRAPDPQQAAAALLRWYMDAGVDVFIGEEPRDRFAETLRETEARSGGRASQTRGGEASGASNNASDAPVAPPPLPRTAARLPVAGSEPLPSPASAGGEFPSARAAVPDEIAIADARERALSATSLDELRQALEGFGGCNLRLTAKSLVFGDGNPDADIMLIGEAPGRDEDIAGTPFVGRSGQLLNRMLAAIGLEREQVRVTNTVPWRPPGNRPPTPAETEICRPFVTRQIELVAPKIVVCLGSPAAKAILRTEEGILRLRGRWQTYSFGLEPDQSIPAFAMLHPAYLLRQPAQKKLAWRDLLALKERIDAL